MRFLWLAVPLVVAAAIQDTVQVIAHRGASWDAPEHTLAAYDLALERGADWIEQDLQMTRDGHLVVLHDDSLDRTARGPAAQCRGFVRDQTLAALEACEVGSWFNAEYPDRARAGYASERIPTLDTVLARYASGAKFYIETKNPADAPGMEDALVALLRKHRLDGTDRVLVQSFSVASLRRLHELDPRLKLVLLIEDPIPRDSLDVVLDRVAQFAVGIGPARAIVSAALVDAAHKRKLVVHPYTVNDEPVMRFLLGRGVDGMFTDRPDVLRRVLGR